MPTKLDRPSPQNPTTPTIKKQQPQVPGGPRVEGVITASSRHAHYVPSVTARLHGPAGDQIWTALVNTDTHFNLAAPGPGVYKIW